MSSQGGHKAGMSHHNNNHTSSRNSCNQYSFFSETCRIIVPMENPILEEASKKRDKEGMSHI